MKLGLFSWAVLAEDKENKETLLEALKCFVSGLDIKITRSHRLSMQWEFYRLYTCLKSKLWISSRQELKPGLLCPRMLFNPWLSRRTPLLLSPHHLCEWQLKTSEKLLSLVMCPGSNTLRKASTGDRLKLFCCCDFTNALHSRREIRLALLLHLLPKHITQGGKREACWEWVKEISLEEEAEKWKSSRSSALLSVS